MSDDSIELSVTVLRESFRNLIKFRSVYADTNVDVLVGPDGIEICLWDLEALYSQLEALLSPRQYQAIEMFLVMGYQESQVAEMMGISPTSPIGLYATQGIKNLIRLIGEGQVNGWSPTSSNGQSPPPNH